MVVMAPLPERTELDGIVARRWEPGDVEALHQALLANLDHLRPWMSWARFEPLTLAQRAEMVDRWDREWRKGGEVVMGIWREEALVGGCGLMPRIGPGALEIGYWVHVDHQGQGIATTAARALTGLAFTVDGIQRVEIHHDANNHASRRVPEKLGYTLVTTTATPDDPLSPGEAGRDWLWQITRADWIAS